MENLLREIKYRKQYKAPPILPVREMEKIGKKNIEFRILMMENI